MIWIGVVLLAVGMFLTGWIARSARSPRRYGRTLDFTGSRTIDIPRERVEFDWPAAPCPLERSPADRDRQAQA